MQETLGRSAEADRSSRVIRSGLTEVLAAFVGMQSLAVLGSADSAGLIWASAVTGPPGFAKGTGPHSLSLALDRERLPLPLSLRIGDGPFEIGLLFPDGRTRLRLRVNGIARSTARGIAIETTQVFTNCPGRLRRRTGPARPPLACGPTSSGESLTPDQQAWITAADTFFIATASDTGAADASHRGGDPGFVEVLSPTELMWPEYPGNSMLMTLGNLVLNPRAGALFLDERTGTTLQLTGTAHVLLTDGEPRVRFEITRVVQRGREQE
ncbi:hypothetical protein SAMN04487983_102380 [Streptomyces sp. yr375]|nr:hypothetical protein SAMN04487983_102380 [Streptomyces sp. yr375]